jgi:hypothetical protein
MAVSEQIRRQIIAAQQSNRALLPPAQCTGIGQFQSALVPAMFGGLGAADPVPDQPLGTSATKISGFDQVLPSVEISGAYPEGMLPIVADDDIALLQGGVYMVLVTLNATVSAGVGYSFAIYVNDVSTGVGVGQDLSNQTAFLTAQISIPIMLEAGDRVSIYGTADAPASTFIMQNSQLYLTRVR